MLDVGHINSVTGRSSSTGSQGSLAAGREAPSSSYVAIPTKNDDIVYVISRVRVDNLQDIAILEYRSEHGEVKEQFPTEKQIRAFKEAERLETRRQEQSTAQEVPQQSSVSLSSSQESVEVSPVTVEAPSVQQAAPQQAASSTPAPSSASEGRGNSSFEGTSILV